MNVLNYTSRPASWQVGVPAKSRTQVLETMLEALCTEEFLAANPELGPAEILKALIDREQVRSTAVTKYGFHFMIASLLIAHLYLYVRFFI